MIPLIEEYNVIYSRQSYESGKLIPTPSVFMFWVPAGLMAVNNFLTMWDLQRSLGFGGLIAGGILARSFLSNYNSLFVQCIQVDS